MGVFLLFFTIPENTFSGPVDTLNLQLQWVYPLKVKDLKLVDFNGDGINEILVGYDSDSARVGILDAVNQTMLFQSHGLLGPVIAVEAGDLNRDGITDIFCGGKFKTTYVDSGYLAILYGSGFDSTYNLLNLDYSVTTVALYSQGADTGCILLVGTWYFYFWECNPQHPHYYGQRNLGNLFQFNCSSLACACTTNLGEMGAIKVFDIDGDGINDVICGHTYNWICPSGTSSISDGWCKITVCFPETIETVVALEEFLRHINFGEMVIGDVDGDVSPEVVISYYSYGWTSALSRLFCFNAGTWEAEWSIQGDSIEIKGLATCHLLNGPSASLCVAYQNGIIRIKDGVTGTDLAISGQLPRINHFVLGNVDQDSLTEICIVSDDSLYVYETPSITTDVEEIEDYSHPEGFCLFQNYPNPFNPQTNIGFALPVACNVTITIYSILGEKVREFEKRYEAGTRTLMWDGKNSSGEEIASGVYLYKLSAGSYQETKKMVLIR
jgi:hypothetical protein